MMESNSDIVEMKSTRFWGFIRRNHYAPISAQTIKMPELFEKYFVSYFGINLLNVSIWGKLYRCELIEKSMVKPTGFKMGEDLMFNMQIFPYCNRYTIIDYRGYNYRVGGLTSRYNPTLWSDLKDQYLAKREFAEEKGYTKALRTLNIELKNIFVSTICQRLEYIDESQEELVKWVHDELCNVNIWADINSTNFKEPEDIYNYIRAKDSKAIVELARQRFHENRWRRRLKKILSKII